ncbi:phage tail protein [Chitinophaga sp. G-6-1-13]|uniref:Phage tail protein n=1 Tax=Chitinophaga fulva TaxID=2728842 RepID=A0A848GTV1_9BACT|nr:phage tail protein [Chitinophaga fulva]NML40163.1 phage tail protein [Chitinophaga fulva]
MAEYPIPKFHFEVKWGDTTIGFTEVTGLDRQVDVIEYREGQSKDYNKVKMPGLQKSSNITMKRGTFPNKTEYFDWFKEVNNLGKIERRTITIKLLNEVHQPVFTWSVLNAFPVKVQASDLKADANEIAVETIEIAHEGISLVK